MFVYKINNLVNGKLYIGYTKRSVQIRYDEHIESAFKDLGQKPLDYAFRKYGIHNFKIETIGIYQTIQEMKNGEAYFVDLFDTINPEKGYNLDPGGGGNASPTEATRKRMSESKKGKKPWNTGKNLPQSMKDKIGLAVKGKNNGMYNTSSYLMWVKKYGVEEADRRNKIKIEKIKETFKIRGINKGEKGRSGKKSNYDLWLEKFGKEEADIRRQICIEKRVESRKKHSNEKYSFLDVEFIRNLVKNKINSKSKISQHLNISGKLLDRILHEKNIKLIELLKENAS